MSRPESESARNRAAPRREPTFEQVLVACGLSGALAANVLANTIPLNGHTTAELAGHFHERFRPAGYVFSIWSLIYLGLIVYALFQFLPAQRHNPRLEAITAPFLASCAANVAWLFCWHFGQVGASLAALLALLGTLVIIYRRLRLSSSRPESRAEHWCVEAPFRIYLAWVSVAVFANFSVWLEAKSWVPYRLSENAAAVALVILASLVSGAFGWVRRDSLFLSVTLWALIGIGVRNGAESPVTTAAVGGIVLNSMFLVRALLWNRSHGRPPPFQRANAAT